MKETYGDCDGYYKNCQYFCIKGVIENKFTDLHNEYEKCVEMNCYAEKYDYEICQYAQQNPEITGTTTDQSGDFTGQRLIDLARLENEINQHPEQVSPGFRETVNKLKATRTAEGHNVQSPIYVDENCTAVEIEYDNCINDCAEKVSTECRLITCFKEKQYCEESQ
jgi:hypothetical protein